MGIGQWIDRFLRTTGTASSPSNLPAALLSDDPLVRARWRLENQDVTTASTALYTIRELYEGGDPNAASAMSMQYMTASGGLLPLTTADLWIAVHAGLAAIEVGNEGLASKALSELDRFRGVELVDCREQELTDEYIDSARDDATRRRRLEMRANGTSHVTVKLAGNGWDSDTDEAYRKISSGMTSSG